MQESEPIHPRHIDVGDHQVDATVRFQRGQSLDAVVGEQEADCSVADLLTELLQDESLQVWLIVNDEDPCTHCSLLNAHIDFAAKGAKIDGFGEKSASP